MSFFKKFLKITTIRSSNSTSGYTLKGDENGISKRYIHSHVYCSIIHNLSVHEWVNGQRRSVYVYARILFSQKKEGNSAVCDNMDWTLRALCLGNKPNRERQILPGIT